MKHFGPMYSMMDVMVHEEQVELVKAAEVDLIRFVHREFGVKPFSRTVERKA